MSDYVVKVTVRNGPMLRIMRANGMETAADLWRASGVDKNTIGKYLALKRSPLKTNGEWKGSALKIADALRVLPEDLFPRRHLWEVLKTNSKEVEMTFEQLSSPDAFNYLPTPEEIISSKDHKHAILKLMDERLNPREKAVLEMRFGMTGNPMKLDDVGHAVGGVSRERVRQMEAKAIRKLRNALKEHEIGVEA